MSRIFRALLFLSLGCRVACAEERGDFWGPVELGNQYPLALQQPSMRPKRAAVTDLGTTAFSFTTAWSNTSIREDNYVVDDETFSVEASLKYGLARDWQISLLVPMRSEGGGILDSFIDGWHQAFGLPRGDRPRMDDNERHVSGRDHGGRFDLGETGFGLGSPELGASYCFEEGSCAGLTVGLPSPSSNFGQQAFALGVDYARSFDFESWSWSLGGSLWFYGDQSIDSVQYRPLVPAAFAVAEYVYDPVWHFFASLWGGLQGTEGIEGHPAGLLYLDVGTRIRLGDGRSLDIVLRENPYPGDGTTDLSLVVGLTLHS